MALFGGKKTISIDFASDEIKIAEGKYSKKGLLIDKFFSVSIPNDLYMDGQIQDLDQLSYLLKNSLELNKVTTANTHCVISSTSVIIREVTMPNVTGEQIASILNYQLEEYLPINPEDYIVEFMIVGQIIVEGQEKLKVILVAIPRDVVEEHLSLLKNMDLKPAVLDYQGNAISKLIYFGDQINHSYSNTDAIICLDLGYENTSLTITHEGMILLNRVIEIGYKNVIENLSYGLENMSIGGVVEKLEEMDLYDSNYQDSESSQMYLKTLEVLNNLMDRIDMIFRYYKTVDLNTNINLVLVHGSMANMVGIEKVFEDYFNIPCAKLENLSKVKFDGDLSKYANAIGGLVRRSEEKA